MTWKAYSIAYALKSPLHVGYHKVGNVQRTRAYVPARNVWGAVTETLTRRGFTIPGKEAGDYQAIGEWVKQHCAFSYWYLRDENQWLKPEWSNEGLKYGPIRATEFESRYCAAHVTTALDPATTSAMTGSLHEIEIIVSKTSFAAPSLRLEGWVFLDDEAASQLGTAWPQWLGELQIGGERRYGFGHVRLAEDGWRPYENESILQDYQMQCDGDRPLLEIPKDRPLLAHTLVQDVEACGDIEPVVGRETTRNSSRFGQRLTNAGLCWVPGSISQKTVWIEIGQDGVWKQASSA